MTTDFLFFSSAPGVDLLFGAQGLTTDATVEITGSFASLSARVAFDQFPTLTVAAQFPHLTGAVTIIKGRELALEAQFAQLEGAMRIARNYDADVLGQFAQLTGSAFVVEVETITIQGSFPIMMSAQVSYNPQVARPTVSQAHGAWHIGATTSSGINIKTQETTKMPVGWATAIEAGLPCVQWFEHRLPRIFVSSRDSFKTWMQDGTDSGATTKTCTHEADRQVRLSDATRFQDGSLLRYSTKQRFQDGVHGSRAWRRVLHQEALQHMGRMHTGSPKSGTLFSFARTAWFQDGMVPPPGISRIVVPPVVPAVKVSADLLFELLAFSSADLLFGAGQAISKEPIFVPIQRVYFVLNHVSLRRVMDGAVVPTLSMSLGLDVSSWTWGFDASLPGVAQGLVEPTADGPVELEALVNGAVFRVLAENISRERTFGQVSIKVSGRGCNAVLDAPYSAQQVFGNLQMRTSQQLMEDVLTFNGVSLGYGIDYGLDPWEVPAGVFNHQGTYITALSALAQAGGGYLIPHRWEKSFAVRHLYPVKPWEVATPDVVLPADVVVRESIAWKEMPAYNRVYVSGQEQGVLGRVTRAGTAGELLAPMVTDALITTATAARQRGLAVLGNTGRKLEVGLSLPVLEAIGIIDPGTYVQYLDGSISRIGIVRSTQISVGFPEVMQTLGVEVHA